jgi:hypothetical protein
MFTVTVALAVLPAASLAVPVTTWPCPSLVSVTGDGQVAMPEVGSEHVKLTVTSVLCHPAALAEGDTDAVMVGASPSAPTISTASRPPAFPLTSTAISLEAWSVTGFSTTPTFWFSSFGARTCTPLSTMLVLETFSRSWSSNPPLWTRRT